MVRRSPMKDVWKKLRGRRAAVAVAGLILAGAVVWLSSSSQPSHQGRELESWLKDLNPLHRQNPTKKYTDAEEAVRAMGVDAIPQLLRLIQVQDSVAEQAFRAWGQRLQPYVDIAPYQAAANRRNRAAVAFGILGDEAVPALPELDRIAWRPGFTTALKAMGEVGAPAIPMIMKHVDRPDPMRGWAIHALGMIGPDVPEAVPMFVECLQLTNDYARACAAQGLYRIAGGRAEAVDALIADLNARADPVPIDDASASALAGTINLGFCCAPELLKKVRKEDVDRHRASLRALEAVPEIDLLRKGRVKEKRSLLIRWVDSAHGRGVLAHARFAVIPVLIEAMHDEDEVIRDAANHLLHHTPFRPPDDMYRPGLYKAGDVVKEEVLRALRQAQAASEGPEEPLKVAAIKLAARTYGNPYDRVESRLNKHLQALIPSFNPGRDGVPDEIREDFPGEVRGALAYLAGRSYSHVRLEALRVLAETKSPMSWELGLFVECLTGFDSPEREVAARGLGTRMYERMPHFEPVDPGRLLPLADLLRNDPVPSVRAAAAEGLMYGYWKGHWSPWSDASFEKVSRALLAGLADESLAVRVNCAQALASCLTKFRASLGNGVGSWFAIGVGRISFSRHLNNLVKPRHVLPKSVAADEVVRKMVALLDEEDPAVVARAVWSIGVFCAGGNGPTERLTQLLDHEDAGVRTEAVFALAELSADGAEAESLVSHLLRIHLNGEPELKEAARLGLADYARCYYSRTDDLEPYIKALDSSDLESRLMAVIVLSAMDDRRKLEFPDIGAWEDHRAKAASPRLWEMVKGGEAIERVWALIALERIDPEGYADAAAEGIRFAAPD